MTPYAEMCCDVCGGHMKTVGALHRTGPRGKGCNPHWQCGACIKTPPSRTVLAVTDAVQLGVDPRTLDGLHVVGAAADLPVQGEPPEATRAVSATGGAPGVSETHTDPKEASQ